MTVIELPLSQDSEDRLRRQAEAAGKDIAAFVLEAVEEKIRMAGEPAPALSAGERSREWLRWTASHRPVGYWVDDSRESIYAGRGE